MQRSVMDADDPLQGGKPQPGAGLFGCEKGIKNAILNGFIHA